MEHGLWNQWRLKIITIRPIQFCDLALISESDPQARFDAQGNVIADWFCIATAVRIKMLIYLLDLYRAQIPFPEQVKALYNEHVMWHSWQIGIESHGYQWALGQQAWKAGLPVVPATLPGDKVTKWQLSTPHFETGRVRIRGQKQSNGFLAPHPSFKRFYKEALDAPFGDNDDTVDAISGAIYMLTSPDFANTEPTITTSKGFAVIVAGGTGRKRYIGDPYDVFRSNY